MAIADGETEWGVEADPSTARCGIVSATEIRKFAMAIDDADPVYVDRVSALAAGYRDIPAPPLFTASVTRPIMPRSRLLDDGQFDDFAPPGFTHLQTILAGQKWDLIRTAVAGETVEERTVDRAITTKEGRSGPITFVDRISTFTVDGDVIETNHINLALRAAPLEDGGPAMHAASVQDRQGQPSTQFAPGRMTKRPDMISAFMFSAVTWAVHRIHYDDVFARSEGFVSPILPGWMLASYLAQLAQAEVPTGRRLRSLDVRYHANAHPGDELVCTIGHHGEAGGEVAIMNASSIRLVSGSVTYESA